MACDMGIAMGIALSLYFLTASLSPDHIHGKCHGHSITLP